MGLWHRQHIRAIIPIAAALGMLAWSVVQVGASDYVVLSGKIAHDHGDIFAADKSVEYEVLETGTERLRVSGALAELAPGTRVRVRGRRDGDTIVLAPGANAVTALPGGRITRTTTAEAVASQSGTGIINKRVAVLLVNFTGATPKPSATPTPTAAATNSEPPDSTPPDATPPDATPQPTDVIDAADGATPSPDDASQPPDTLAPTASPAPTPSDTPAPSYPPTPTPTPAPSVAPTPTPSATPTAPPEPWTPASVSAVYFTNTSSVASYYADVSEGQLSITGDVFGWFTVGANTKACNYSDWGSAARQAATAHGIDLATYTNVVYAFPKQSVCSWNGLANVVGRNSWLNGTTSLFIASHELGHNFGVHHSSSLTCTSGGARVAFSSNCTSDEYGDPFDIMGYHGQRLMSTYHRWQLGFLTAADVQTVNTDGVYRVATAEVAGGTPRVLRVARPGGDYCYLEFRQPSGPFDDFSATAPVVNGVTIRIAPDVNKVVESRLIDTNPQTATFNDAPLAVGRTFADLVNQIFITTLSIDPTGATVQIHYGADLFPPTKPSGLTATAIPDGTVRLDWNGSMDNISVTGYVISRDGVSLGSIDSPPYVDQPTAQAQVHSYVVKAFDQSGNFSGVATTSVFVPDVVAPSTVGNLVAQQHGPQSVSLTWTAANDNVGVIGYLVTRDGTPPATVGDQTYLDDAARDGFANQYTVAAIDAAGNVGAPSPISVDVPDVTAPELPGTLSAIQVTPDSVALAWPGGTDNVSIDHYEITRDGTDLAAATVAAYTDSGLAQAQTYDYEVVAIDPSGLSSTPLSASLYIPDTTPPASVGTITTNVTGPGEASISWPSASDNVGVDHYLVGLDGVPLAPTSDTSLTHVGVAEAQTHDVSVAAVDAAGNVGEASIASFYAPDLTPPTTPDLLAQADGPAQVDLAWTPANDNIGVTGYVLERDGVALAVLGSDELSYTDTDVPSDRTYTYSITALDAAGNSSPVASALATLVSVDVAPPTAPSTLLVTALGRRHVNLTWSASTDNRPGVVHYLVYRGRHRIATVTSLSYVDWPAKVATYRYRVRAVDACGNKSKFSTWIKVKAKR